MSVRVHKSSYAASEARTRYRGDAHPGFPAGISGMFRGTLWQRTYHILLRLPRFSWGIGPSPLCWYCTNSRFCTDTGRDVIVMLATCRNLLHSQKPW
jgi:hypothetical protein